MGKNRVRSIFLQWENRFDLENLLVGVHFMSETDNKANRKLIIIGYKWTWLQTLSYIVHMGLRTMKLVLCLLQCQFLPLAAQ